jgi:hypothetical protein
MSTARVVLPVALLALTATSAASAGTGFAGNVCTLIPARQIAPIVGSPSHCTKAPTTQGPGSTMYVGTWTGPAGSPHLQLTISAYSDQGVLQMAKLNLRQGLPGGTPKRVTGIGSAAYEASASKSTGIHFSVGKYVAYLTLGKPRATASLEALAKTIAARL